MKLQSPRTWTLRTTYDGATDLQVVYFPYQRQAYAFAIDWFVEDPALQAISIEDDSGWADRLDLTHPRI